MRRCRASAPVQCGVHLKFSSLPTRKPKLASVRATAEAARRPSHHDDPGTTTVPESQEERRASPQSSHPHAQELVVYFIWMAALLRPASATVWSASGQSWRDGKPSRSSKRSAPACAASCANLNSAATRAVGSKRRCTLTGCPVALSTSRNWTCARASVASTEGPRHTPSFDGWCFCGAACQYEDASRVGLRRYVERVPRRRRRRRRRSLGRRRGRRQRWVENTAPRGRRRRRRRRG
mmetsp:Transcript_27130/g.108646  ORF Transcript_27130/g.108646 Transcript_27130/m.108646 type:complete len:237 (+) Transcript_27130:825-1535(+)